MTPIKLDIHPFIDEERCFSRLKDEYDRHKKLVVGFDFDNTIFDVHNNGGNYSDVISLLQRCKELGFILCLYTSESDKEHLAWKVHYCEHFKINPDYINESPLLPGTTKPFFNVLLDDRAGLGSAYRSLKLLVDRI